MSEIIKKSVIAFAAALFMTGAIAACGGGSSSSDNGGGGGGGASKVYWGTVYTDASGAHAKAGATVTVTDSQGTHTATTDGNGYFEITSGQPGNDARVTVGNQAMVGAVTIGNCDSCHNGSLAVPIWTN